MVAQRALGRDISYGHCAGGRLRPPIAKRPRERRGQVREEPPKRRRPNHSCILLVAETGTKRIVPNNVTETPAIHMSVRRLSPLPPPEPGAALTACATLGRAWSLISS
jgi:hypothetical protein